MSGTRAPERDAVPVLLYHAVAHSPSSWIAPFTVTPATFARHMDLVRASGRTPLSVEELRAGLAGEIALPARSVVITFDDGFADLVDQVAPVLAAAGLPATMFVTTGFVDRDSPGGDPMLSWSGVAELAAAGFEIGAHSVTHPQLDVLGRAAARSEIVGSRHELEDHLELPVRSFAYPHGYSDPRIRRLVREAGFESACAVRNSLSHDADRLYALARLTITDRTSEADLEGWLAGRAAPLATPRDGWRTLAWRAHRRATHATRRGSASGRAGVPG